MKDRELEEIEENLLKQRKNKRKKDWDGFGYKAFAFGLKLLRAFAPAVIVAIIALSIYDHNHPAPTPQHIPSLVQVSDYNRFIVAVGTESYIAGKDPFSGVSSYCWTAPVVIKNNGGEVANICFRYGFGRREIVDGVITVEDSPETYYTINTGVMGSGATYSFTAMQWIDHKNGYLAHWLTATVWE